MKQRGRDARGGPCFAAGSITIASLNRIHHQLHLPLNRLEPGEFCRMQHPFTAAEDADISAMRVRWRTEGFRRPCSIAHMYVRCIAASSTSCSCDQPFFFRRSRMRLPTAFETPSARWARVIFRCVHSKVD